jgi:hypothetical protein
MITKMETMQELQNASKGALSQEFEQKEKELFNLVRRMIS